MLCNLITQHFPVILHHRTFSGKVNFSSCLAKTFGKVQDVYDPKNTTLSLVEYFKNPNIFDAVFLMNKKEIPFVECKRIFDAISPEHRSINLLSSMFFVSKRNHQQSEVMDGLLLQIHSKLSAMKCEELRRINPTLWNMMLNGMNTSTNCSKYAQYWYEKLHTVAINMKWSEKNLSCLLNSYSYSGNAQMAMKLFSRMDGPTLIDVTMLSKVLIENYQLEEVVNLLCVMSLTPDAVLFTTLIKSCTAIKYIEGGKAIHKLLIEVYPGLLKDTSLITSLINFYSKCSEPSMAIELYKSCGLKKNVITWNCYLQALISCGKIDEAFYEFQSSLKTNAIDPSNSTFVIMLSACTKNKLYEKGEQMCKLIEQRGYDVNNDIVTTSLITFYSYFNTEKAIDVFKSYLLNRKPDTPLFNSMLQLYCKSDRVEEAFSLFHQFKESISLTDVTFIIMLDACAERLMEVEGETILKLLPPFESVSLTLCNSILKFYSRLKQYQKASDMLEIMVYKNKFDFISLISMMSLYSDGISLKQGLAIHQLAIRSSFDEIELHNSILNFYGKVGEIDTVLSLFENLKSRNHVSIVTWNVVLGACAQNGKATQAERFLEQMIEKGFEPNEETFLHLFNAYSHCMMPHQLMELYNKLPTHYNMEPTIRHTGCLVDGLVRFGLFDEAETVIGEKRDLVLWSTYLAGCRKHNDLERATKAFAILKEIDKTDSSNYVLLSNIYAYHGNDGQVEKVKNEMKVAKAKKIPGISTIEVNGQTHNFVSDDKSHPEIQQIEAELMNLTQEIIDAGYESDLRWVTRHGVKTEEEKKKLLYRHSEKIAMAFAFIHQPKGSTIRIANNLRVCGDCHNATKYISLVRKCKIIVRDERCISVSSYRKWTMLMW